MDASALERNILEWDEGDVHAWFTRLGFPQYEAQINEHNISGEVLCFLNADSLKEIGITTIGQRLAILKAVYNIKLVQNIPIEADDYVPPSEVEERQEHLNVERLYDQLRDQNERLRLLEEDNRRLSESLHSCLEDINSLRTSIRPSTNETDSPVGRQHSFKWASFVKPSRSPTKAGPEVVESPQPSPNRLEHEVNSASSRSTGSDKSRPHHTTTPHESSSSAQPTSGSSSSSQQQHTSSSSSSSAPKPTRQDSSDNLKSFKVSLDDPAWKVLPAALKKYKINNDDWQNYAMFICYGSPGNRIERCLSYDEKPLLLFQKLKDAKKNPVFMLKHIKDIRSPIAVAQQKQAARKAGGDASKSPSLGSTSVTGQGQSSQDARSRPPKLQVDSHANASAAVNAPMTGVPNAQSGWPELMSPAVETKERGDEFVGEGGKGAGAGSSAADASAISADTSAPSVREIPPSTGVSYAVAIYPYMAEQEDEFDVVVGDTFIILSRARGWWVVQRDPAGSGTVEPDTNKQGWVPAGCLLETSVPVATAIAEATARGSEPTPAGTTPILPLSILSTSFPGIALMDYKKKGEEELDLEKDDSLRVFKRYNHWSYAVKEESGDRGWVPSWFIGKVPTPPGAPQTPSTSGPPHGLSASYNEGDSHYTNTPSASLQPQVSPMSSAFPPMQTRSATATVV
ncbi:hypothetical protein CERSUDRAFT_112661 [Gelatoporia subvermispora B]|uniref:Uncharacterized protein n=1 Tax=Ceriporiopsis subvermispora (strain B) TaxID=914234 RepID=M2QPI9_CERS8|nr:hypothetical protein CERSUDRAFT_112661 [Gelatoporia subvermispora B]